LVFKAYQLSPLIFVSIKIFVNSVILFTPFYQHKTKVYCMWIDSHNEYCIAVFPVFRLFTDFVCLLIYEFCLSLWKIARCLVILLLPLFAEIVSSWQSTNQACNFSIIKMNENMISPLKLKILYILVPVHTFRSEPI